MAATDGQATSIEARVEARVHGEAQRPTRSWRSLLWIVPVLALVYARPLWFGAVFFRRDIARYIHPIYAQTRARFAAGELPLWSRGEFGGMPMLGDVTNAVLYPPNLALLGLSSATAISLLIVGHHLLSAFGAALLMRRWAAAQFGLRADAPATTAVAASIGLCFSLSGYAVGMDNSMQYLVGMSWAPWVLLAIERLVERPVLARAVALGALYACLFTSGELQFTYLAVLLGGAYVLVTARPLRAALAWFVGAGLVAFGLCAVQLFPLVPVMLRSTRASGLALAESQSWAMHPLRLIEFFWAHPFGVLAEQSFWGQALVNSPGHTTPWANGLYLGAALPILALCAPLDRLTRFLLALGGLALFAAMGPYLPLDALLRGIVPLWSAFRYPEKLLSLVTLCLCLCAGRGLLHVLHDASARRARWSSLGASVLTSLVACALWLYPEPWLRLIAPLLTQQKHVSSEAALTLLRESATRSALISLAALALVTMGRRSVEASAPARAQNNVHPRLGLLWALLLTVDVASANVRLNELAPSDLYDAPMEVAEVITKHSDPSQPARIFRLPLEFTPPPGASPEQLNLLNQYWLRQTLAPKSATERDLRYALGYAASMNAEFVRFWQRVGSMPDQRGLDLLAVRYLLDNLRHPQHRDTPSDRTLAIFPAYDVRLVLRAAALPMARVVYALHPVRSQEQAFERLGDVDYDPRNSAIVETQTRLPPASLKAAPATTATFLADGHASVELDAEAAQPGLLLLAATFDSGWQATVDGKPAGLLRVNAIQQGVMLSPGRHKVHLRYHASGLAAGALVSAATALAIALAFAWDMRRRRR